MEGLESGGKDTSVDGNMSMNGSVKETQTGEQGLQAPVRVLMKHLLHNGSSTQRENNFNMV